jgi:hypothetical protein
MEDKTTFSAARGTALIFGTLAGLGVRRLLATLWPWVFGIAVANGVFLVIGSLVLICYFDPNTPDLFVLSPNLF